MTRWMAALLLIAGTAAGQAKLGPCLMDGSDCAAAAGSGTVTTTGSPSSGQVALVSGATSVTGDAGLTYDPTTNAFSGTGPWTLTPASDIPSLTVRRFGAGQTSYVLQVQTEINGFLSGIDAAGTFVGPVTALKSATTSVDVSAATAPSTGQVLKATDSTHATWQADSGGITNSAGANVITKSDGTNVVATALTEASAGAIATTAGTALGLTATAPAATTGASQAGKAVSITASPAVASTDTAGAAAGGSVTITAGAAARNTSGNANGGDISLVTGAGIGTGTAGQVMIPSGTAASPSMSFASDKTRGVYDGGVYGLGLVAGTGNSVFVQGKGMALFNSGTLSFASGATGEAIISLGGSATIQLGAANSSVPVAQTLGAQGGSGTNIAGQPWTIKGSLGTGSADSGAPIIKTGYPLASGTTQHTASTRIYPSPHWTALTESSATGFVTIAVGSMTSVGGEFLIIVKASDATDVQTLTSTVRFSSSRKATGNTVSTVSAQGTTAGEIAAGGLLSETAGGSTLTCAYTATEGATVVTLNADCVSSLTQTTLSLNFQSMTNGAAVVITPL